MLKAAQTAILPASSYCGQDLASRSQFNTTNVISVLCLRLDSDCWFNVSFKLDAYYLVVGNWKPEMGPELKGFWHLVLVSSGFSEEIYFLIRFLLIWNYKVCHFLPERTRISFKSFDKYFFKNSYLGVNWRGDKESNKIGVYFAPGSIYDEIIASFTYTRKQSVLSFGGWSVLFMQKSCMWFCHSCWQRVENSLIL